MAGKISLFLFIPTVCACDFFFFSKHKAGFNGNSRLNCDSTCSCLDLISVWGFSTCGQLRFELCISCYPRKQLPSPAKIHPTQAMFLPRLQWDPGPASHHVQEALLPVDLWVNYMLTLHVQYLSTQCVSCWRASWYKLWACLLACHFVFTQNIMRVKHHRCSSVPGRPDWLVLLSGTKPVQYFFHFLACGFLTHLLCVSSLLWVLGKRI